MSVKQDQFWDYDAAGEKEFLNQYRAFVVKYWGERCEEFEPECPCCQGWARYDAERKACEE